MAAQDQLEIISPSGAVLFYDLNTATGLTNIGRHPANDIVIDGDDVAPFHAVLDHRQKPYQFVVLSETGQTKVAGEVMRPNVSRDLQNWDTIELDGHALILMEGIGGAVAQAAPAAEAGIVPPVEAEPAEAAPPEPAEEEYYEADEAPAAAVQTQFEQLAKLPPDRTDNIVVVEFKAQDFALDPEKPAALEFAIEVEQAATFDATIINGGDIVATFDVRVEGLNPRWVRASPAQINLFEGERGTVAVALSVPRAPSSRAGAHYFSVVITSPNHPGHVSSTRGMLLIKPFHEFSVGELSPRQQTIAWSKRTGQAVLPIINKGNSEALFRVDGEDDEHGCLFEFHVPDEEVSLAKQADLRVRPDSMLPVPIDITPHRRQLIALRKRSYSYTITTTPLEGQQTPRSVIGQVQSAPLIGSWLIALFLILVAAVIVLIFRPTINYFGVDPEFVQTGPVMITAGDSVTLRWRASPFASLRIDPDVGQVDSGTGTHTVSPAVNTVYLLTAENLLTRLSPRLFGATREAQVIVDPVLPRVKFSATTPTGTDAVVRGQSVTLAWEVAFAEELILSTNGAPETIPTDQHVSSRVLTPENETTYILQARNRYTGLDGVIARITIKVNEPTGTPLPMPVIQRFDVQPLVITDGQSIRLEWAVAGVDKVSITPLGTDFAPNGVIEVSPKETTTYLLVATNGRDSVQLSRQVIVSPAPTPAPPPEAPKIEFFTITPPEVVQGSEDSRNVKLAWSVTGDFTNIEISGPDVGRLPNLDRQGSINLTVEKSTLYILTAFNDNLSASQTVQIKVIAPTATPTSTPLPTPTGTPSPTPTSPPLPVIIFSAAANNSAEAANVVPVSTGITNTYRYRIMAGTLVRFSWNVSNAVKVTFLNEDKAVSDSTTTKITAAGTHILTALNAFGGTTQVFIQIELTPRPVPPAPTNIGGTNSIAPPLTITWSYDTTALSSINGFRIYRATLPSTSFTPIGDAPNTSPFQYVDTTGGCGMAYYVVAVYTGINNEELTTAPSSTSWNSPSCPLPTATP